MSRRKDEIKRPDKRIGVRIETLAYLFDVSVQTIQNAVNEGKITPSRDVFGVKLYHVETVERAIFHLARDGAARLETTASEVDPYLEALRARARTSDKRRDVAA